MDPFDFNDFSVDSNNEYYDPEEEAARLEWGPVFDAMMVIDGSAPEDVHELLRTATNEELGIPIAADGDDNVFEHNAIYLLLRRLVSRMSPVRPDTLTTEAFDILLDRYPEMFTTFRNNDRHQSLFSRIFLKVVFEEPEHEIFTIVPEKVLRFVQYLKSRGANPGCAFVILVIFNNYNRPLIEYLARNYDDDYICALDILLASERITNRQYEDFGRISPYFRRRHALAALGRTRRNKNKGRRNKSRRLLR